MRYSEPADPSPAEVHVSATSGGFEITVGYSINHHWYPCRRLVASSERGARRAARRLIRWYDAYVGRQRIARRIVREVSPEEES